MLAIPACSSMANLSLIPWLFQFILGIHELFDIWFVIGTSEFVSFSFFRLISKLFDSVLMFPHCFKGFLIYNFFSFNFFHLQKIWFLVMISSFYQVLSQTLALSIEFCYGFISWRTAGCHECSPTLLDHPGGVYHSRYCQFFSIC